MTRDEVLAEFEAARALLRGHFILSSGLRSAFYLQCARVLMNARRAERLCRTLADKVRLNQGAAFDMIVSPAMGGVVAGHEMGRQFGIPAIFFERVAGAFALRRGFEIAPGARLLLVEDVVTTGGSSLECMAAAQALGGQVAGACCLVDRSGGRALLGVPFTPLIELEIPLYVEDELPESLKAIPAVKPGSRGLT